MNVSGMLTELNDEIARLTQIRDLLTETASPAKRGPGRPKGSEKQAGPAQAGEPTPKRRVMSSEAREKIAAAQRKRWAKASAGKKRSKPSPKPGVVKTIRAVPPAARKVRPKPASEKKAARKNASIKTAAAKKRTAKAVVSASPGSDSGSTVASE